MVNVLKVKVQTHFSFLFSNEMLVIMAGIHKMLVRIENREDPDQTASFRPFWQATSIPNLRTFTIENITLPTCPYYLLTVWKILSVV